MRSVIRLRLGLPGLLLALSLVLVFALPALAGHGAPAGDKTGILLVSFGTSVPEARVAFDEMDAAVKAAFPDVPVRWAFTSNIIREKLEREGLHTDSVPAALARMLDDGFTRVAAQSLHAIPGEEFNEKLLAVAGRFRGVGGFAALTIGLPLMTGDADMGAVAEALLAVAPKRAQGEALVVMGHGTHHPANIYYPALQWYLRQLDPLAFVGTVEGTPGLDYVLAGLKIAGAKKAVLMPLMSVAGDHARNDMAGDEEDSWKSVLTREGIAVRPVLHGLAEYPEFRALWLAHLRTAMDDLAHGGGK